MRYKLNNQSLKDIVREDTLKAQSKTFKGNKMLRRGFRIPQT